MKKRLSISIALFCFLTGFVSAQVNIYVDASKPAGGNGSSWANAYNDLNAALKYANETAGAFDIHVAAGTYKPTDATLRGNPYSSDNVTYTQSVEGGFEDGITFAFAAFEYSQSGNLNEFYPHIETDYQSSSSLGARDVAFSIKGPGVRIFGGYPVGGGTRNVASNLTYLDGDIGTAGNSTDNAYHVMLIGIGEDNYMSTDSIVVDGFTVKNGNANGTGSARCNGYGVAQNQGGGIYNLFESASGNTKVVAIRNCTFSNNYAYFGSGVFNESCNGTISNCSFTSNTSKSGGAAIYINGQAPIIKNCSFSSNSSRFFAGGIFAASTTAQLNNCSFSSNSADSSGSCLYNLKGGIQLNNCTFSNNTTSREAGAIRADYCNIAIAGCTFTSNSASLMGGALLSMKSNLTVTNSTFKSNTASWRAGALWMRGKNSTSGSAFSNCTFESNTTTNTSDLNQGWGGVLLADSSAVVSFSNCTFKSNSSKRGGMFFTQKSANLTFSSCIIQSNTSSYGAGIGKNESGSTISFNNCQLLNNTCTTNGQTVTGWGESGSLIVNNNLEGVCTINMNNTLLSGNKCDSTSSSGLIMNFAKLNLNNCVFVNNHTKLFGAGVYNEGTDAAASIISCTFRGNTTEYDNSIFNAFSGSLSVRNTINDDGYYGYYQQQASYDAQYSYFNGSSATIGGTGNKWTANLGFTNVNDLDGADNVWGTSDDGLTLTNSSPCKDAGFNSFSSAITTDFAGNSRLNGTIDMGAYEQTTFTPANVLTFAGDNDYITIPHFSRPSSFTIEARVKTSGGLQSIVSWGGTNSIDFRIENGKLFYGEFMTGGANFYSTSTINDGQWHHVAVVRNGDGSNNTSLYIDGVLNVTTTSTANPVTSDTKIGSWGAFAEFFNGQMDEVRFWTRALCGGELTQNKGCELSGTPSGLWAYYKFNQGNSGAANAAQTNLADASGNSRNGTLTNFDLTGTNNWMQASSGVSTTSCGAYTAPTVTASSNSPVISGGSLSLTGGNGFSSYAWTGPNSFSSSLQNPTLSNVQTNSAGTYTLTASQNGCIATASTNVTVNSNPASALVFDGGDGIVVPHYALPAEYTLEAKFKTSFNGSYNTIMAWTGANGNMIALNVMANGKLMYYLQTPTGVAYNSAASTAYNDDQWHHIAVTQSTAKSIKIYVDGAEVASFSHNLSPVTDAFKIGEWPGYASFVGQLDEVRVWSRQLCSEEINNGKNCEISASSNGLVVYYRFNQGYNNADNTATTTVTDLAGGDHNGTLTNFALTGTASNWILASGTGSVTTGNSCAAFNTPNLNSVVGNATTISNGDNTPSTTDNTDFGVVDNSVTTSKNFTITNNGSGALTISGITVSGTDASNFSVSNAPTSIAANSSATFKVNFIPSGTTTLKNATITINSSDCRNTPYTFAVSGTGILMTPGAALNFDGVDDKALASSVSLGNDFTIEAKVKFSSASGLKGLVTLNNGGIFKGIILNNGYFTYWEQNSTVAAVSGNSSIADNSWHHVAAVRTSAATNNILIYVDGVNVGVGTSAISVTATDLQIGSVLGGYSYGGEMDEVRLWNRALCAAEIANATNCEISASSTGLYAYYKFNQGNAANDNTALSTLTDATSNAKNAAFAGFTLNGATSNFIASGGVTTGSSCGTFLPADIAVTNATNIDITNNDNTPSLTDNTDFGDLDINANPATTTFTLKNVGTGPLTLNGTTKVIVSGTGFALAQDAAASVAASGSTTFNITFDPNVTGAHTGTVTIYSNDCDEPTFTFSVQGNGIGGVPTAAALNFSSAGNNYITANVGSKTVSGNYTVEMWVKPASLQNTTLFSTRVPSDGAFDIQLTNTGGLHGDIGTGHCFCWLTTNADANVGYTAGNWFHVAYVVTPTKYEIYFNGNLASSGTYSGTPLLMDAINNTLVLGAHSNGTNNFNGDMDEVRIWNRPLCRAEIVNNMNNELSGTQNGLVAYYQFNQGQNGGTNASETTLTDVSGNNLNGTLTNFSLSGSTSNWIAPGGVTTGNYASAYMPSEISIAGDGDEIVNGDNTPSATDNTDWGNVQASVGSESQTFTISNLGAGNLALSGSPIVVVTGTGFTLTTDVNTDTILPNNSANFTITFAPPAASAYTGTVTIYNNDCDEPVYTFSINGTGYLPPASTALTFDGSNDYVSVPNTVSSDFTIEYWMKTTQVGNTICGQWYCGNGIVDAEVGGVTNDFGTALLGSKLSFGIGNPDISIQSVSDVNTGQWVHVAATWIQASGAMKLYINGTLEASGTSGTALRSAPPRIVLGMLQTNLRNFSGSLDEVRIWDRALCEEEISNYKNCEVFNSPTNLKSYYRFNEYVADLINTGNTTLTDHSGNSNNGTLYNFALTGTTSNWTGSSVITSNYACAAYDKPVIGLSGNSTSIANNDNTPSIADATDFGYTAVGSTKDVTFTVSNTGTINNLVLSGVSKVTVQGSGFSLNTDASATIAGGSSSDFTVTYTPTTVGTHTGSVTIYSNDCETPVYTFAIQASSIPAAALDFDGVDDNITISGIDITNKSFTIECWAKSDRLGTNNIILGQGPAGGNTGLHIGYRSDDTFTFAFYGNDLNTASSNSDNNWHHWACVYDLNATGTNRFIYKDGVVVASDNSASSFLGTGTFYIGQHSWGANFDGAVDEVRIWDRALCATEIMHNMNAELTLPQTGLLAYYQFNQGGDAAVNTSETSLLDASGNNYNGTLTNMTLSGSTSNWIAPGAVISGTTNGVYFPAEIDVLGNSVSVSSNDNTPSATDNTDFGSVLYAGAATINKTFTISNNGNKVLNLGSSPRVTVSGSDFTLVTDAPATIQPGSSATFEISFDPSAVGVSAGSITIANDDCDESSYTFAIQGTGRNADPANALHFDGVDDYVSVSNPFYQYNKAITVEWHVNVENSQLGSGIGQGSNNIDNPATNVWLMHLLPDKSLFFGANINASGSGVAFTPALADGWHHIVGVATPQYTKLYVDGQLINVAPGFAGATIVNNASSEIHFGKDVRYSNGRFFQGKMDEVRIWNRALTGNEINYFSSCERNAAIHNPKGLVGYYKLDQGLELSDNSSVTTVADSSVYAKNGTLNNFALNGSTSNWILESPVVTNNYCTPCSSVNLSITVNECSSSSYVSPSGLYTWTSDGTYNDTLITSLGCDSIITVNLTFNDLSQTITYNPSSVSFCGPGQSTQFEVVSSQAGVVYELLNMADTSVLAVVNGGSALQFNTGAVNSNAVYGIRVSKNGCSLILNEQFTATVKQLPNTGILIDRTNIVSQQIGGNYQWVDCTNSNSAIAGATINSYTPALAGNYAVIVTSADGCIDTSACITFTPPVPASALNFDGVDDHISVNYKIPTTNFTTELWFKTTSPNGGLLEANIGGYDRSIVLLNGDITTYIWPQGANGLITTSGTDYADGNWHHVAFVMSSIDGQKLYVDGQLKGSASGTYSGYDWNTRTLIGYAAYNGIGFFNGTIDQVRIWERPLTQDQIINRMGCDISQPLNGLALNYNFNQGDSAGANQLINYLSNANNSNYTGALNNFALTGNNSNWMAPGAIANTAACVTCVTTHTSVSASTCGAAYVSPSGRYTWTVSGVYTDTVQTAFSCDSIITVNFTNNAIDTAVTQSGNTLTAVQPNATYQWLDCGNGNAAISGEINQSYFPADTGNYAVVISRGSCIDTSFCVNYIPLPPFVQQYCVPTLGFNDMYRSVVSDDFNGDGFVDLMGRDDNAITHYFTNDGNGNLSAGVDLFTGMGYSLASNDIDNDGDVDLIVYEASAHAKIYTNDGTGVFTLLAGTNLMNGTGTISTIKFGDVNGDGKTDILTGNNSFSLSTDMNEVWINTGTVGNPLFSYLTGVQNVNGGRNSLDLGDIDGDGDMDLVTGSVSFPAYTYKNDGTGMFTLNQSFNEYSGGARFIDWDKDGDLDKVTYDNYNTYGLRVSLNDGAGNFDFPSTQIITSPTSNTCVVSDLNGDGNLDLVFDSWGGNAIVYTNTGCNFVLLPNAINSNASHGINVNDFNNDGKPDVFCMGRMENSCVQINNIPTATSVPATTVLSVSADSSCGASTLTLAATASNNGGLNWYNAATNGSLLGTGAIYNTPTISSSTTYYVEAVNSVGCKSVRVPVIASVYSNPAITISGVPVSLTCPGSSVTLSANGASTYSWSNGVVDNTPFTIFNTSTYQVTGTDVHGCSSSASATINVSSTSSNNIVTSICEGGAYTVGSNSYSSAGTYNITLTNSGGCDSLIVLNLSVNTIDSISISATICEGTSYTVGSSSYTSAGTHYTTLTNAGGCDSVVVLALTVNDIDSVSVNASICDGSSYTIGSTSLTSSGIHYVAFTDLTNGCDSIVAVNLTVNPKDSIVTNAAICSGNSYSFGGNSYTASGTYVLTSANVYGCDSVSTLVLTVLPSYNETADVQICTGSSYAFGGSSYTATGTYNYTYTTTQGCDSMVTLNLNVVDTIRVTRVIGICEGQSYIFGSQALSVAGTYTDTTISSAGCDSLTTLILTVNAIDSTTAAVSICAGDSYNFNGSNYSSAGVYFGTFTNAAGCDSVVELTLTVNALPGVSFAFATDTTCDDGGVIVLAATPTGGTFTGTGVSGTAFDPSAIAAAGYVNVTYAYTDGNSCTATATDSIFVDICTGIAKTNSNKVSIQPNPTEGVFVITASTLTVQQVEITNAIGQVVYKGEMSGKKEINISGYAPGVYTVKVSSFEKTTYTKVVKQ